MKYRLFAKKSLFLALAALAITLASCIKEDLDECYKFTLVVHNHKGDDITPQGTVSQATLFVFDETGKFLEKRDLDRDFIVGRKVIELNYPENQKLHCVAWGNLKGNQQVSNATKADDLTVSLIMKNDMAQAPDSLFFGSKDVTVLGNGVAGGNQEIVVVPKTGTIEMVTIGLDNEIAWNEGLRASSEVATCQFYMDRTKSKFDSQGNLMGDSVSYNPDGTWKSGEWETPKPQSFVEGQNMVGTLTVNGRSYPVTKGLTDDGKEENIDVLVFQNKLVQFQFDEQGQLSVRIKVTPWGVVEDDPELKPNN
jgi:Fimbrillin-A associated anchor proteins Mfa1 and Mfa2